RHLFEVGKLYKRRLGLNSSNGECRFPCACECTGIDGIQRGAREPTCKGSRLRTSYCVQTRIDPPALHDGCTVVVRLSMAHEVQRRFHAASKWKLQRTGYAGG